MATGGQVGALQTRPSTTRSESVEALGQAAQVRHLDATLFGPEDAHHDRRVVSRAAAVRLPRSRVR